MPNTFNLIFDMYSGTMLKVACGITRDKQLAEDAVQESFLRISKNLERLADIYSPETRGYILTITRNASLSVLKARKGITDRESVLAFLLTTGLYLPLLFDWCGRFYPIGMSSLLRLVQLGENIEFAAFMVCGLYAVIIAICHRILKRHIWRIHEVGR